MSITIKGGKTIELSKEEWAVVDSAVGSIRDDRLEPFTKNQRLIVGLLAKAKRPLCIREIARLLCLDPSGIRVRLQKLEALGILKREERPGPSPTGYWTYYSLNNGESK